MLGNEVRHSRNRGQKKSLVKGLRDYRRTCKQLIQKWIRFWVWNINRNSHAGRHGEEKSISSSACARHRDGEENINISGMTQSCLRWHIKCSIIWLLCISYTKSCYFSPHTLSLLSMPLPVQSTLFITSFTLLSLWFCLYTWYLHSITDSLGTNPHLIHLIQFLA